MDGYAQHEAEEPRRHRYGWAWAGLALILATGGASYVLLRKAPPEVARVQAPPEALPPAAPAEPRLPPVAETDAQLRGLLGPLSAHASWRAWLGVGDLLTRWVTVVDNLAEGISPKTQLAFLHPKTAFRTTTTKGSEFIDPSSYARYDLPAAVIASIDAAAFVDVFRKMEPLLDQAYRAFGYPGARFEPVMRKAIARVLAPVPPAGRVEVISKGALYVYADPALEALGDADKQLLRLGPANLRKVQAKAREVLGALNRSGM